jgi:hypothetical protein
MNELENPSAQTDDSNEKIESLRSQMNLLFGCLLVASLTLTAYLALQARRASLEALALKGPAAESAQLLHQDDVAMGNTLSKLAEFGRTHPDFQKIVRFNTNAAPVAPAVPAAPAKK